MRNPQTFLRARERGWPTPEWLRGWWVGCEPKMSNILLTSPKQDVSAWSSVMWCFSLSFFCCCSCCLTATTNVNGEDPILEALLQRWFCRMLILLHFLWGESGRHRAYCLQKVVLFCLYLTCYPGCPSPSILRYPWMPYCMFFCCLEFTFSTERHSHPWTVFPFLEALAMSCAKDLRMFKDKTQTSKKDF